MWSECLLKCIDLLIVAHQRVQPTEFIDLLHFDRTVLSLCRRGQGEPVNKIVMQVEELNWYLPSLLCCASALI